MKVFEDGKVNEEVKQKINTLKQQIIERAFTIIHEIMPSKVLQINELLHKEFPLSIDFEKIRASSALPDFLMLFSSVSSEIEDRFNSSKKGDKSLPSEEKEELKGNKKRKMENMSSSESEHRVKCLNENPHLLEAEEDQSHEKKILLNGPDSGTGRSTHKAFPSGIVSEFRQLIPANSIIVEILPYLKKELLQLIEMINDVKIWIQLNIPRIEDGNNFGVSIQEETVNELTRAEENCFSIMENISKYFANRAKLISKLMKYPQIDDYRESIHELDQKEVVNFRLCFLDLRNQYASLHDMIIKNLEKLKSPRNSHHLAAIL